MGLWSQKIKPVADQAISVWRSSATGRRGNSTGTMKDTKAPDPHRTQSPRAWIKVASKNTRDTTAEVNPKMPQATTNMIAMIFLVRSEVLDCRQTAAALWRQLGNLMVNFNQP